MRILTLDAPAAPELAAEIARFEAGFTYPLGPTTRFRISHGDDHTRFFRAIGPACCAVALHNDRVLGLLAAAIRPMRLGTDPAQPVGVLGDLKIDPEARSGVVLRGLLHTISAWLRERTQTALGIVMDGTAVTPDRYTGRLGIPGFPLLTQLTILRVAARPGPTPWRAPAATALAAHARLTASCGVAVPRPTAVVERSRMTPQWFCAPDGSACGRVEDTALAKRLITTDDVDLQTAHVSAFAWNDVVNGATLLRQAAALAAIHGHEGVFVAIPAGEADGLCAALSDHPHQRATAGLYGAGAPPALRWLLDSAEM